MTGMRIGGAREHVALAFPVRPVRNQQPDTPWGGGP